MSSQQKPRLDPRMVFAVVLVAIPVVYVILHVIAIRGGAECGDPDHAQVGGLVQMFVPGDACETTGNR